MHFPGFNREIDSAALTSFLLRGYVPGSRSIYRDVRKVAPGTILTLREPSAESMAEERYWSAAEIVVAGLHHPFRRSEEEAVDELDRLLRAAVKLRLVSDVPLGAFLSGGVDSSVVALLLHRAIGDQLTCIFVDNGLLRLGEVARIVIDDEFEVGEGLGEDTVDGLAKPAASPRADGD